MRAPVHGWLADWRLQLALILLAAVALRSLFFVGFGLGDDLGYIAYADTILAGSYPPLDPLNQYAYRPLLLLLFAGGIAVFGHTDLGVVAPVLLSSLVTTALVFVFVRKLIDPSAAWWGALIYAFEPFNAVNSTTMTNDVILACLTFAGLLTFLLADRSSATRTSAGLFAIAGLLMVAAFLVKITFVPVLAAICLYSLIVLRHRRAAVLKRHSVFYGTLLFALACVCFTYYVIKGDFLWQFKAETYYYQTNKPNWYLAGAIDYASLMWQYPRSMFGLSGYPGFRYLEHGLLFWLFVPAAIALVVQRDGKTLKLLVIVTVIVFVFFQFYPQHLSPRYVPLVRQERYLELLLPATVIVVGTTLRNLAIHHPALATALLGVLLVDFTVEGARRSIQYDDSQEDMRALARYAGSTIARTGRRLAVDRPAGNALSFYLRDRPVSIVQIGPSDPMDLQETYVAVGGARSFWWSRDEVLDIRPEAVPPHWVLAYSIDGRELPWRPSQLRVYYAGEPPPEWFELFDPPRAGPPPPVLPGLICEGYPEGFDGEHVLLGHGKQVLELDNSVVLPVARLQWSGWMRADGGVYTFETNSDDGSWIYLNDKLLLDNGGTHPARIVRRTVRLAQGWYAFRLRYEDTGGDRLLRVRVYRNHLPAPVPPQTLFFSSSGAAEPRQVLPVSSTGS